MALVFVALGKNFDHLLVDFSQFASNNLPNAKCILITDTPRRYEEFCGFVIEYSRPIEIQKTISHLHTKRPELSEVAGGFWFLTLERLLALSTLQSIIEPDVMVIHLENDVLSFISEETLAVLQASISKVAFLRWHMLANAGILFSPSNLLLQQFILRLHDLALRPQKFDSWTMDMQILKNALVENYAEELPTVSGMNQEGRLILSSDIYLHGRRLICDSGDLGIYLFGRNSVYSRGRIKSGYRYPHINWPIELAQWRINWVDGKLEKTSNLLLKFNGEEFVVPFLHIASKINLVESSFVKLTSLFRLNEWVNGATFPSQGLKSPTIHQKRSLKSYLGLIRRNSS